MEEQVDESLAWLAPLQKRFELSSPVGMPVGRAAACELGKLQILHLSGLAQPLRLAPLAGRPVWVVGILQREGSAVLRQGPASPPLPPACLALLSSALPFEIEFAAGQTGRQTWVVLPQETLHGICPECGLAAPEVAVCAGLPVRMIEALADLLQAEPDLPLRRAGQHVADAFAYLLAAAMAATMAAQGRPDGPARTSLATFHLARIKQFVLANLNDPELTVRKVSERLKISPSHIHRVFLSEHETFGEWLWAQRLAACRAALEKSGDTRQSISQIAFGHGFSNSSHFSRAFKARFGMSPSEARGRKKSRSGF